MLDFKASVDSFLFAFLPVWSSDSPLVSHKSFQSTYLQKCPQALVGFWTVDQTHDPLCDENLDLKFSRNPSGKKSAMLKWPLHLPHDKCDQEGGRRNSKDDSNEPHMHSLNLHTFVYTHRITQVPLPFDFKRHFSYLKQNKKTMVYRLNSNLWLFVTIGSIWIIQKCHPNFGEHIVDSWS